MHSFLNYYEGIKIDLPNLVMRDDAEMIGSSFCIVDNDHVIYDKMIRVLQKQADEDLDSDDVVIANIIAMLESRKEYLTHMVNMNIMNLKTLGHRDPQFRVCNMLSAIAVATHPESEEECFVQVVKSAMSIYSSDGAFHELEASDLILYLNEEKTQWVGWLVQ